MVTGCHTFSRHSINIGSTYGAMLLLRSSQQKHVGSRQRQNQKGIRNSHASDGAPTPSEAWHHSLFRKYYSRKSSGFTLFELVMVLLVMAIIVGIVAPSISGFAHGRQSSDTADELVTLARLAQTQAISEGTIYRLNLDLKGGTYWISTQDAAGEHRIMTSSGQTFQVPNDVQIQSDIAPDVSNKSLIVVHFYPNGRTEPGTFRLSNGHAVIAVTCPSPSERYAVADSGGAK